MGSWIDYSEAKPDKPGVYGWVVPNLRIQGSVSFAAHMRERNAGYQKVLSPQFDHWNGYRISVPEGTQWRTLDNPPAIKSYEYADIVIDGVEICPCPFCKTVPKWRAIHRHGRGVLIGGKPHEFNVWWLECCSFAKTPHSDDPIEMARRRNQLIREFREATEALG